MEASANVAAFTLDQDLSTGMAIIDYVKSVDQVVADTGLDRFHLRDDGPENDLEETEDVAWLLDAVSMDQCTR